MATAKIGQVIKFKNSDGSLNGGTLVDLVTINGKQVACVNAFDDNRIQIPVDSVIIIKHQREGDASPKIIRRTKKEILQHNKQLEEYGQNERMNSIETKNQELQEAYDKLLQERNSLLGKVNKYNELETKYNDLQEKYDITLKNISKAENSSSIEVNEMKETISALCSTISMLSSNSVEGAFDFILDRIKKFHKL